MLKNENKIFLLPLSQYSQVANSLISPRSISQSVVRSNKLQYLETDEKTTVICMQTKIKFETNGCADA